MPSLSIQQFLQPLAIDGEKISCLARKFAQTYKYLARNSDDQFLPTPITQSSLPSGTEEGRYLAVDLGGTNLRVGFIELLGNSADHDASTTSKSSAPSSVQTPSPSRVNRMLERCWPIGDNVKKEKAEDLFKWVGRCLAEVIESVYSSQPNAHLTVLPLGVTFSFPMVQDKLGDAILKPMGKGFAITSNLDLRKQLLAGYAAVPNYSILPRIRIVAISNDAVATLAAFTYQYQSVDLRKRPTMAVIVGTGNNAAIPIPPNHLHPSKRPMRIIKSFETERIVVNTEWSIKGTAPPLHQLNFITQWDSVLDAAGEAPGFMPFEYMTSGRYISELCRIIVLEYFLTQLDLPEDCLHKDLRTRNGFNTTFIGNLKHNRSDRPIVEVLKSEFPSSSTDWNWTKETAEVVCEVGKAVERRAAGMLSAAIIGLLAFSGDIKLTSISNPSNPSNPQATSSESAGSEELLVGFTGGCITHFQEYLKDCQEFLNVITAEICEGSTRVVLEPCHDGGIIGAGVLAGKAMAMRKHSSNSSADSLSDEEESLESFSSSSPDDEDDDNDDDGDAPMVVTVKAVEIVDDEDEGFAEEMDIDDDHDDEDDTRLE